MSVSDVKRQSVGQSSPSATVGVEHVDGLPEQNLKLWVLPLDSFIVTRLQTTKEAYLHALLSQKCLTSHGFAHHVPAPDLSGGGRSREGFGYNFDVSVASAHGYHPPFEQKSEDEAWSEYINRSMSDAELSALDRCVRDTVNDTKVPKYDNDMLNYATNLARATMVKSAQDPRVATAAQAWRKCMLPRGIDDLPMDPHQMPTPSMIARYGWHGATVIDSSVPLTSREVTDAVADAKCRDSAGYERALYAAEWDGQVSLLQSNRAQLDAMGARIIKTNAAIIEQTTRALSGE
jgi:hypothetical protein